MFNPRPPLRYKVSSWRQLPECLSNNSKELHIHLTDFYNNPSMCGFRISVDHDRFGTVFACVLNARGEMITPSSPFGFNELSPEQILRELRRFGFFIEYRPNKHLPGPQIEYIITLRGLGYDKLRKISVWEEAPSGCKTAKTYLVAFQSYPLDSWLSDSYCPSKQEFTEALVNGTACNLTEICKTKSFNWNWLDYVANIDDIIRDNADDMINW